MLAAAVPPRRALDTSVPFRQLRTAPEARSGGHVLHSARRGLPPGQEVELQWATWQGSYATKLSAETVAYESRQFTDQRQVLGRVRADAQGTISGSYVAPEDFGELHEIFAVVDGEEVARGGFRIKLAASIEPADGPVGTLVTVTVTGMAAKLFSGATLALRYDNAYTGVLTATTTRGTARAEFQAAGPVGQHVVMINAGSVPAYLNALRSRLMPLCTSIYPRRKTSACPSGSPPIEGPPANRVDWPLPERVQPLPASARRTTASGARLAACAGQFRTSGRNGALETSAPGGRSGTQRSSRRLLDDRTRQPRYGQWLEPGRYPTGHCDRRQRWAHFRPGRGAGRPGRLARAEAGTERPGGGRSALLCGTQPGLGERHQAAGWWRASRSISRGWAGPELDNGFAMTYDNAYAGYACGFNSNGDVTLELVATGGPGTHLIDLYPMVYAGKDAKWWYWTPVLTYARDFPRCHWVIACRPSGWQSPSSTNL